MSMAGSRGELRPDMNAARRGLALAGSPLIVLAFAVLACAALLTLPVRLPLGAMYWDLVVYLDAANRIGTGQTPALDFFAPVGPLGYWLFAGLGRLFPQSQPLLLVQWSVFLVTAPALALVLREVDRHSRLTAFALLLPYLIFQILPVNVEQHSFFPGVDGFGIYNRQVSIVLYVLASALVFMRDRRVLSLVLLWTLLALLLIKITGFLAGGLLAAFALAAGRLDWPGSLAAAGAAVLALLGLELATGLVSAYLDSIVALVAINAGGILPRFLQAGSLHLDIVAAGGALIATLLVLERKAIAADAAAFIRARSWPALNRLADHAPFWLAVVLFAGLFFETQNTGGQAFVFAWPVLLMILRDWIGRSSRGAFLVMALVAATAIPPAETVLQRAGRSLLAQTGYVALPHAHLGRLGLVSQHRDVIDRARAMRDIYATHRATYREIADRKMLPSHTLYADLDFQALWLLAIDSGVAAILAHEAATGARFETIMSLNFTNPFPYLMQRTGVRHIAIGADPFRAVPALEADALAAVAAADLILEPLCPITVANEALKAIYAPAMTGRREIALGTCWKGYVRDELGIRR
jgi:hypothetical protein